MLGLTISLASIPGISNILSQLDKVKADFLSVPSRLRVVRDTMARARPVMSGSGVAYTAIADANQIDNAAGAAQAQWDSASSQLVALDAARRAGGILSVAVATTAISLVANVTSLLSRVRQIEAAAASVITQYLSPAQQQNVATQRSGIASVATSPVFMVALVVGGAYLLTRRRR